jgi:predicted dehydrogenase
VGDLRIGIIGLDTSHSLAFAKLLNDPDALGHVPGGRIVAAVKTFSADMPASAERVDAYAETIVKDFAVRFVQSIEELCEEVDAVLIESLDGRAHPEQARRVFAAKKPVFIDKPIAGTLRDVMAIFQLAREADVPVFSSSAYRFYESLEALRKIDVGGVRAAVSYGPAYLDPHHPDLFFYGVHPLEALYTVLGRGCESVVRSHTVDSDVVTGSWSEGRLGVLHGLRTKAIPHKVIVFGATGAAEQEPTGERFRTFGTLGTAQLTGGDSYIPLLRRIMDFFRTGIPPVAAEETIEMFAFMEAAEESKRRGGQPVMLAEVIALAGGEL